MPQMNTSSTSMKWNHALAAVSILTGILLTDNAAAAIITLNATADNSGLIEDGSASQHSRADTLWGTVGGSGTRQRNGLVQFQFLDAPTQAGLLDGSLVVASATLRLWNSANAWTSTTLNFHRLNDADTGWAAAAGADNGTNTGRQSWANLEAGTAGPPVISAAAWSGTPSVPGGGPRGQIFGTLTSARATAGVLGDTTFNVPLSGTQLVPWLTSATIAPNLLVEWAFAATPASETTAGQTRFATINSADGTDDQFAPDLILDIVPAPEPSVSLLGLLTAVIGSLRRRR